MRGRMVWAVVGCSLAISLAASAADQRPSRNPRPGRSLQEAVGYRGPSMHVEAPEPSSFAVGALGTSTVTTSKGFSTVSSLFLSSCENASVYPASNTLFTATIRTGDAQDRIRLSFSGMAEIGTGVPDGVYVLCSYTVIGDPSTYACPTDGWGLILSSSSGQGMGAAVAFTNVISGSQVGPNKELTFKFAITKADSASVGGSICSSTLTLER